MILTYLQERQLIRFLYWKLCLTFQNLGFLVHWQKKILTVTFSFKRIFDSWNQTHDRWATAVVTISLVTPFWEYDDDKSNIKRSNKIIWKCKFIFWITGWVGWKHFTFHVKNDKMMFYLVVVAQSKRLILRRLWLYKLLSTGLLYSLGILSHCASLAEAQH